jgi:hypothetical protein
MRFGFFDSSRLMALLLGAALFTTPACFARGPAYVGVEYVPPNYATYPSYQYDGATVYLIDGRWYRRDHGHWGYYRSEPRELYRYRSRSHVVVAPPARSRNYGYSAPRGDSRHYSAPRVNSAPRVYSAPPARDNRRYQAPRRDEHNYRAPSRDNHRDRGRGDDRRRPGRD